MNLKVVFKASATFRAASRPDTDARTTSPNPNDLAGPSDVLPEEEDEGLSDVSELDALEPESDGEQEGEDTD